MLETSLQTLEESSLCNARHTDDAAERPDGQGFRSVNGDGYSPRVSVLDHHVVAALDPVKTKSQPLQSSDRPPAAYGRVIRHLANSNNTLQFGQLGGREGYFLAVGFHRFHVAADHFCCVVQGFDLTLAERGHPVEFFHVSHK